MALTNNQRELLANKVIHLSSVFETKEIGQDDDDNGFIIVEGYASTSSKDRSGDVIDPSVWNQPKSLENYKKNPIVLAYHDHKRPIGVCESLSVDANGLKVRAKIFKGSDESVFKMVQENVLKAFSVGFRLLDLEYKAEADAFYLTEIELFEISVVSVPDNQDSLFNLAKSLEMGRAELKQLLVGEPTSHDTNSNTINMTPEELQALIAKQLAAAKAEEDKARAEAEAKAKEKAELVAAVAKEVSSAITVTSSGAEKLAADLKAALDSERASMEETIKSFKADIEAKSEELLAMQRSKMVHGAGSASPTTTEERQTAVLLAKCLRKPIEETAYGKALRQKAAGFNGANAAVSIPGPHTVNDADWETEFMTEFYRDIRRDLVVEPLFRTIQMNAATMRIPVVPEQGYASYIAVDNFRGQNSTAAIDVGNRPTELTLVAHKLSASDKIGMEEQEDTILPILPIIRENIARRMARSSDRSLLRGVGTTAADPIKGLTQYAIEGLRNTVTLSVASGEKLTALKLQQARRQLGVFGMRTADVVYIISTAGYYDLLEDPDMRKYFDVGPNNATLLNGEIARVNGSAILVSDEFAPAGVAGNVAAVVVNMRNFIMGSLRGMTMKTDDLVKEDSMLLVATRRFGMLEMEEGAVSVIEYVA